MSIFIMWVDPFTGGQGGKYGALNGVLGTGYKGEEERWFIVQ